MINEETKWTRGSRVTAALLALIILWGLFLPLYFFTLPTEGWLAAPPPSFGVNGFVYRENLIGMPSELQKGDLVTAIDGVPIGAWGIDSHALESHWQAGNSVRYRVQRGGKAVDITVPLARWPFAPALRFWLALNGNLGSLAGYLLFVSVAALAFLRRPGSLAARALVLLAALFLFWGPAIMLAISNPAGTVDPLLGSLGAASITLSYTMLFPPILIQLAMVFPRPKPIVARHPWLAYSPFLIGLGVIPLFVLTNGFAGYMWTILSIVLTIGILIHTALTTREPLSRAQLTWGLWGFIIAIGFMLPNYLTLFGLVSGPITDLFGVMSSWSLSLLGITLAVAILRYRLFDIGIIIRRTLVYSVLTALLALVYFGSVVLLQQAFRALTGQGQDLAIILSTLAIAALAGPLRSRVQAVIDRRFFRRKYDATHVLQTFAAAARDEVDLTRLTDNLMGVVEETIQPESVSVWLRKR